MRRKCDHCGKVYHADPRNIKRGWGLCCSKSCAAKKREGKTPALSKPIEKYVFDGTNLVDTETAEIVFIVPK